MPATAGTQSMGSRSREKGKRDRKGGRKIQAFITELTAETGGETASCSCNKAHLHSGFRKPTHLWTFQLGEQGGSKDLPATFLLVNICPMDKNSPRFLGLSSACSTAAGQARAHGPPHSIKGPDMTGKSQQDREAVYHL